jgi:6-phosphogluconate dehydrogenase
MDAVEGLRRIGIVGAGSMGSMMALAFSELGLDVSIWDVKGRNVDGLLDKAKKTKSLKGSLDGFYEVEGFMKSLDQCPQRLFLFSITHGSPADSVVAQLHDQLRDGDIILDGGNEHYRNTERRQGHLSGKGVTWIGVGVSGGYQAARHGPSLSPGGDAAAVKRVLPLLEKYAARDSKSNRPCVEYIGPHGSGHYVKMVHNGIENGMLSTMCEAWSLLSQCLGLTYDEIGNVFDSWNATGELKSTYIVEIGSEVCHKKKEARIDQGGDRGTAQHHVLSEVLDKVVQDDDDTEGTLYWSVMEAAQRHIAAPTIAAGQFLRVASGNRAQRLELAEHLKKIPGLKQVTLSERDRNRFIEDLRLAVYASFLCSYCQGLELIARASADEDWNVNLATCVRIWRSGCIIRSDHIADLLEPALANAASRDIKILNIKLIDEASTALADNYQHLKEVVQRAGEWDASSPSLSASLEYLKYVAGRNLPTQFMEAEMDLFGAHGYDRPQADGEDPGRPQKGAHHFEWRPA